MADHRNHMLLLIGATPATALRRRAPVTIPATPPPAGAGIDWSHPLAQGLGNAWMLLEGGGGLVYDSVKGLSLEWTTPRWGTAGPAAAGGSVLKQDGGATITGGPVSNKPLRARATGSFTAAAWYWRNGAGSSSAGRVWSMGTSGGSTTAILRWDNTAGAMTFQMFSTTPTVFTATSTSGVANTGQWYLSVCTFDALTGAMQIYTAPYGTSPIGYAGTGTTFTGSERTRDKFGLLQIQNGGSSIWDGYVGPVLLWDRTLSLSEIGQLGTQGPYTLLRSPVRYLPADVNNSVAATVTAVAATATANAIAPTVTAAATVTAVQAAATAVAVVPASVGVSVTVNAPVVTAAADALAPSLTAAATLTAVAATATADIPTPSTFTGTPATVNATAATATADALAAVAGAAAEVVAVPATATADGPANVEIQATTPQSTALAGGPRPAAGTTQQMRVSSGQSAIVPPPAAGDAVVESPPAGGVARVNEPPRAGSAEVDPPPAAGAVG